LAPTFVGAVVNGADTFLNSAQRSQLTSLVLSFSGPITLSSSDLKVENIGLITAQTASALASSQILVTGSGTSIITLRWTGGNATGSNGVQARSGTGERGNSLADGNWRVTIKSNLVSGNNVYGTASTDNFFRMYGDGNGDGRVDGLDNIIMRAALASPTSNAAVDFDGNGTTTGGVDTLNFGTNNGKKRRPL
jgi:hypothetical protein